MERKQKVLKFFSDVLAAYGVIMIMLFIFAALFGEDAKENSTIFSLGSRGISIETGMQFLMMSVIDISFRTVFMTDVIIKNLSSAARTALMFASVFVTAVVFSAAFGWFPANNAVAWIMFILCFGISGTVSTVASAFKEKQEDEMLNAALNRIKEEL